MNPTLLIFLKAPVAGKVKTRLARDMGDFAALEIYQRLVRRQMAALPEGWPVEIHFAPAYADSVMRDWLGEQPNWSFWPQVESGLGERLAHATAESFKRGAQSVMLIGGDCPELGEAAFLAGAQYLAESNVVIGPTMDGGYYLLGMDSPRLALFENVAWSTESVADRTREIIREQGWTSAELLQLRDVDTLEDWEALRDHASN